MSVSRSTSCLNLTRSDGNHYAWATAAVAFAARQLDGTLAPLDKGARPAFSDLPFRESRCTGAPGFSTRRRVLLLLDRSERDSHSRNRSAATSWPSRTRRKPVFSRKKSVRAVACDQQERNPRGIVTRIAELVPSRPIGRRAVGVVR